MSEAADARRVRKILMTVKPLAAEYYRLTGKPLGVTGEVAEYVAAEMLGLELAPPRTHGYDAIRKTADGQQRIQIKGRAYGEDAKPRSMAWSRATAIVGSAVVTLASCRIRIVRGHREPPRDCGTMAPGAGCAAGSMTKRSGVAAFQLSPCHRKHNLPDRLRVRPSSDRNGIA